MSVSMQQDIDEITQRAGCQDQKPPKTMPEKSAEKMDQHTSSNHIAHEVHHIGMQGEPGWTELVKDIKDEMRRQREWYEAHKEDPLF